MKLRMLLLFTILCLTSFTLAQSDCPDGTQALNGFSFSDSSGILHQWLAVDDTTVLPGSTVSGTMRICTRTFVSDAPVPQKGKNALLSIYHRFYNANYSYNSTTNQTQDRGIFVTTQTDTNDVGPHYGLEGVQSEIDINGSPTFYPAIDNEISSLSAQVSDTHVGSLALPSYGVNGLRVSVFRMGDGWNNCGLACYAGVRSEYVQGYNAGPMQGTAVGFMTTFTDYMLDKTNDLVSGIGFYATTMNMRASRGFYSADMGFSPGGLPYQSKFNFYSASQAPNSGVNYFGGPTYFGQNIKTGSSASTDLAGRVTLPITLTFRESYDVPPVCVANDLTTAAPVALVITTTTLSLNGNTGDTANYICIGRN